MELRRTACAACFARASIASYVHNQVAPDLGKIGVLVALKSSGNAEKLARLAVSSRCTSRARRSRRSR